ncbi:MAG: hypothetical protein ACKVIW_07010, partial [bacterium]
MRATGDLAVTAMQGRMSRRRLPSTLLLKLRSTLQSTLLCVSLYSFVLLAGVASSAVAGDLFVVRIDGSINPASADYLMSGIAQAEAAGASAVLIELDTPGGLVSSTQDIIQAMLNSTVPTIVFVTPRGATATSAGTFITL